jgi:site-specific DNA-methyltransferase (adenine-specific)
MASYEKDGVIIYAGDSLDLCSQWETPVVIISDGPYGVGGYPGDPPIPERLAEWYEPHIQKWTECSTPVTTLWFWNTEVGWANVHPILVKHGWEYRNCHVWDKGIAHIAGNSNGKTLRKFPVTTEVCVQYTKKAFFEVDGVQMDMQQWLRYEWERTGIPLYKTNEACGVKNAATRKYFTKDHLWYYPPTEAFEKIAEYAKRYGTADGNPFFSVDGIKPITGRAWANLRAKFYFENGVTNVWREPAVRGSERLKNQYKCIHSNQKPLKLINLCIRSSSDVGDVVWEPFGGLCSSAISSHKLKRKCYAAEINGEYFRAAVDRLKDYDINEEFAFYDGCQSVQESALVLPN